MKPYEVVHEASFSFVPSWSTMYLSWGVLDVIEIVKQMIEEDQNESERSYR